MTFLKSLACHYISKDQWKQKAWESLNKTGFPTRKCDSFQYVPLKALYDTTFQVRQRSDINFTKQENTCVFVDGVYSSELSHTENVIALPLSQAMQSYRMFLQKSFSMMLQDEKNPFYLLNHALYEEGLFLYIPPHIDTSITWVFLNTKNCGIYSPKIEVYLGKGASLALESEFKGKDKYWHNEGVSFSLDERASLTLKEKTCHSKEGWGFHSKRLFLKRDAKVKILNFSTGAQVERHDIHATLYGENSEVDLKGLGIISDKKEIHHHLFVQHKAPHTRSNQHYKNVLQEKGRSSFTGKIYVEKEAQKTEAYQMNNNLLLSPKSQAMSKPNLEIFADDVKASHGATCSQPNAEEIFYFRTRGLNEKEAKQQLVQGFCREFIEVNNEKF